MVSIFTKNFRFIFFEVLAVSLIMSGFFMADYAHAESLVSFVKNIGTNTKSQSGNSSISVTVPASGVAAGNTIIVSFASGTFSPGIACADSQGNIYNIDADKIDVAERVTICSAHVTTALVAGNTITATYPSFSGTSTITANEFFGLLSSSLDASSTDSGNSDAPDSGLTALTAQPEELLMGAIQFSGANGATFTPGAGYARTNSDLAGRPLASLYQIVSAMGAYSAGGTLTTENQWEAAIATYKASPEAHLLLIKEIISDNGGIATGGYFSLHVKFGGTDIAGSPANGSETGTDYTISTPGTYTVSEDDPTPIGYDQTSISGDCTANGDVMINLGDNKSCTITNDDIPPILILHNTVDNTGGGTALVTDWMMFADGPTPRSGPGEWQSFGGPSFFIGDYVLSSSGITQYASENYTTGAWSCVGGSQNGNVIEIGLGEAAVCSITHTYNPFGPTADNLSASTNNGCSGGFATFSWIYNSLDGSNEAKFQFQVDNNSDFSSPEIDRTYDGLSNPPGTQNQQMVSLQLSGSGDFILYNNSYDWRVKVWDSNSLASSWILETGYTPLGHPFPSPSFTFSPQNPGIGVPVPFTNNSTCYDDNGQVACQPYDWDFGDGSPINHSLNPNHSYTAEGLFLVILKAYDENGYCDTSLPISVGITTQSGPQWKEISPF